MDCRKLGLVLTIAALTGLTVPAVSRADVGTFANPTSITIPNVGQGSPYPSSVNVAGLTGVVSDVNATLVSFDHSNPPDVEVLLVGPGGQTTMLIGDAGGAVNSVNDTITLDDQAQFVAPVSGGFVNGVSYKPQDYEMPGLEPFNAPAPAPPYGLTLGSFNNTNPNGTWSLYVFDDFFQMTTGDFSGGWSLQVTTRQLPVCRGLTSTIEGTEGNDTLNGTAGADVVAALGGNDTISGLGGNDVVCGGAGRDTARGGAGKDTLSGEAGKDKLIGGGGKDRLLGGAAADVIKGGAARDVIKGGAGKDNETQ
jgi:Ca2+-binding RTX toxin-like protein